MSALSQQLQALRTPSDLKLMRNEELDHHITQNILQFLDSIPANTLALGDDKATPDLLESLDPATDTLPYLYTLTAQIDAAVNSSKKQLLPETFQPRGHLWQKLLAFITNFDEVEIRYAGSRWRHLMEVFDLITRYGKTDSIMGYMAQAMLRLDPSAGTFTSTHLLFVQLCLRTRSLRDARQLLDREFHGFPNLEAPAGTVPCSKHYTSSGFITLPSQLSCKINLNDVLEYRLLGALIYIGLRDWVSASYFLEHVLSIPTNNVAHGFMLEAYRKWLLVGLLANGKVSPSPKSANAAAMKTIKAASKAYESIVEAFKQEDSKRLRAEILEGQQVWAEDGNFGLVKHVMEHHIELSVIRLGKIYSAIPVGMLTARLNMSVPETQAYLQALIDRGTLKATIEQDQGAGGEITVRFIEEGSYGPVPKTEVQLRAELAEQTTRINSLARDAAEADRKLSLTKEYLDHVRRSRKATAQDRNSPDQESMDIPFPPGTVSDEDESVMEDVG